MRIPILGALAMLALAAQASLAAPNIVLIMADDLGWSDTSNAITNLGNPSDYYETPVIDRLAGEGMAFTSAYTNGPNCAPTRAALLTGAYAPRPTNNVYNVDDLNRGGGVTLLVGPDQGLPSGTDAIPTSAFTFAEMLQQAGYRTSHYGKFHVTETGDAGAALITSDHGFHENYGGTTAGGPGAYHASGQSFGGSIGPELDPYAALYTQAYVDANIKPYAIGASDAAMNALVGTEKHVSDALADAALDFMEREKAGPFLVQFHPYAVHTPIGLSQARSDLLSKYQNKSPGAEDTNASFGALIEGLDQSVARLVNYLQTTPDPNSPGHTLSQNTLVLFYSDNGGKQSQSNNGPLKGQKGELDEGGIRVPLIAWSGDPDLVQGGTVNHTPVVGIDFYKTFAAIAGAADPPGVPLDGVDLSPILADSTADLGREAIFWHFPGYLNSGGRDQRPQSVVRCGEWKLLYNYEDQSYELYNLSTDIAESSNVADANPQVLKDLGQKLLAWLEETNAPLATLRSGSLSVSVDGSYYAGGVVQPFRGALTVNAGEEVPFVLGDFFSAADLNRDGKVGVIDWLLFRRGQGVDFAGLSPAEAIEKGDLDGDFDNDLLDFIAFKEAYEAANGPGAFALLLTPEPTALGVTVAAVTLAATARTRLAPKLFDAPLH